MPRHSKPQPDANDPQQLFDWTRAKRLSWLDELIIPRFDRVEAGGEFRLVRTGRMKQLLKAIESYTRDGGEWLLKEETIARKMGVSPRTIRRIVTDCETRGLLAVRRNEGQASWYSIVWSEVAQLLLNNPKTASLVEQPAKTPTQPTPDNLTDTPDNLSQTPDNLTATPDNLTAATEPHTSSSRARGLQPSIQPVFSTSEIKPPCGEPRKNYAYTGFAGWPFKIEPPHLRNGESVLRLWEHALERGYVDASRRVSFFKLARHTAARAERGELENPGGYFHARVLKGEWRGSLVDEQAAVRILAILDCRQNAPATGAGREEQEKLLEWNSNRRNQRREP